MKVVFMGTPAFAVPALNRIFEDGHEILAVITGEDKPKSRGHKIMFSPVKDWAIEQQIPVLQPQKLSDKTLMSTLQNMGLDVIVVAAYGKLLPKEILDTPMFGCINIHASLLPKYRGAAPIQWAIINGEAETGISVMQMDQGLDMGDIILMETTPIADNETSEDLFLRLSEIGAKAISNVLQQLTEGDITHKKQDASLATYAPMLSKALVNINWSKSAREIHNLIRGLVPWPVAQTMIDGKRLRIFASQVLPKADGNPGEIIDNRELIVRCGDGVSLKLLQVQPDGGRRMTGADFANGHKIKRGSILT